MFGKSAAKSPKDLETIVGPQSTVLGELRVTGTIRVDGSVEGDIAADWVVVGEAGKIKGNVRSRGMVIGGRIDGNIDSEEIVEVRDNGQVCGEIRTAKLVMAEGALFDGVSCMARKGAGAGGKVTHLKASLSAGEA